MSRGVGGGGGWGRFFSPRALSPHSPPPVREEDAQSVLMHVDARQVNGVYDLVCTSGWAVGRAADV